MRDYTAFSWSRALVRVSPLCLFVAACSGSSSGGSSAAVLTQAPHCTGSGAQLTIEGTVAGSTITDSRTTDINAGYENVGTPNFRTPLSDLAGLESNQLALTLTWADSLLNGEAAATTSGKMTLPANHPQAGATFCVSKGDVGFVSGGAEDGVFKFAVSEVKAGADCSGATSPADLRGCFH